MLSVVGDAIPLHLDTRHSHRNFDTWVKETPPLYVVTEGLLLWLKGRYLAHRMPLDSKSLPGPSIENCFRSLGP